jgi:nucleotide-binding universal stress UspA family protein
MTAPIILCTDGSEHAEHAITSGLSLVGTDGPVVVVTVVHEPDPMLVTGTGIAGGVMSAEVFDEQLRANRHEGEEIANAAARALGLADADVRVLVGDPGTQICALAEELSARAVVIGSRGRGGLKRALLGSVSDHVVRHAPCPVIITGPRADEDHDG